MWITVIIVVVLIVIFSAISSSNKTKSTHQSSPSIQATNITPIKVEPPEMVLIIGGTFMMGSNPAQDAENENFFLYRKSLDYEKPQHPVTVNSFKISKTMITNEQYAVFLNDCHIGSDGIYNSNKLLAIDDTYQQLVYLDGSWGVCKNVYGQSMYDGYPMNMVTWFGAYEYCKWAGGRLPTEAEWEYAARGGGNSCGYKYSGSNNIDDVAWYKDNSVFRTSIVATKRPNELGLYDMSGNAAEWCSDLFGSYQHGLQNNPTGATIGYKRVIRGGHSSNYKISCRVSSREYFEQTSGTISLGFRLVLPIVEMIYNETIEEIKKLAEQGKSEYQYQLGNVYLFGEGIPKNSVKAAYWHEKAANQNHIEAMRSIAYAYKDADGVEQNFEKSMFWFEKAAKQGDANSQMMIGNSYHLGLGVQKDEEKASFYLKAAAKQNEKTAICLLRLFPHLNV